MLKATHLPGHINAESGKRRGFSLVVDDVSVHDVDQNVVQVFEDHGKHRGDALTGLLKLRCSGRWGGEGISSMTIIMTKETATMPSTLAMNLCLSGATLRRVWRLCMTGAALLPLAMAAAAGWSQMEGMDHSMAMGAPRRVRSRKARPCLPTRAAAGFFLQAIRQILTIC